MSQPTSRRNSQTGVLTLPSTTSDPAQQPLLADTNNHNNSRSGSQQQAENQIENRNKKEEEKTAEEMTEEDLTDLPTPWVLVISLASLYFLLSGIENGVAPCIITTLQEDFNMSTTSVAASQSMSEAAKILGSLGISHFTNKAKVLFVCFGAVVWVVGSFVLGSTVSEAMLYIGFAILGCGYSFLTVLTPPILEDHCRDKKRIPFLLGLIYSGSAIGVAVGFLVCGLTIDDWRWNFFVAAALVSIPLVMLGRTVVADTCAGGGGKIASEMKKSLAPDLELLPTVKELLTNPVVLGMIMCVTFQAFYINAFIALLPKFIEEGLGQSKSTASFILAATVPAAVVGTAAGGYICKRAQFGLRGQLHFCLWTNLVVLPMLLVFMSDSFAVVATLLVLSMFTVFLNASPSLTLLALAVRDERHVSYANGLLSIVSRACGAIPGPIILGVLIDNTSSSFTFAHAYLSIGLGAGSITCLCAVFALCRAPDAALFGGRHHHASSSSSSSSEEMKGIDNKHRTSGGDLNDLHHELQKDHHHKKRKEATIHVEQYPDRMGLPAIQVVNPSTPGSSPASPPRLNPDGTEMSPLQIESAAWTAEGHLQPPVNTFLAQQPEEEEEQEQQHQVSASEMTVDDFL